MCQNVKNDNKIDYKLCIGSEVLQVHPLNFEKTTITLEVARQLFVK